MMFLVVARRNRGVTLNREGLNRMKPVRGGVLIDSGRVDSLARFSVVARIAPIEPLDPDPLPRLLDVTIQGMAQNDMVLSGIEEIDNCFYAQSWWCRFE
ncbi:hypothetical protein C8K61_104151 [Pseudomonas sp. GV071]|nr:hypothetical protein C8K61_104151 [Pseudomonas sp. GV071]